MPTYSYACTECDNRFDAVQAFSEDALTTCPVCSGRLRKLFGSVGVVFKGSGFYRNDSRESAKSYGRQLVQRVGQEQRVRLARRRPRRLVRLVELVGSDSSSSSSSSSSGSSDGKSSSSSKSSSAPAAASS